MAVRSICVATTYQIMSFLHRFSKSKRLSADQISTEQPVVHV